MERGPLACTDAERRTAVALADELRTAGRAPRLEARWVRPRWPAWQALCAIAGVVGTVVSVDHALAGLVVTGAALVVSVAYERGRLPLGRGRATQDVVAPATSARGVALVVMAAVDRPRTALLRHVPAPLLWLQGALVLSTALAAARLAGADGTVLGAAQLAPSVVLLVAAAGFLESAFAPAAPADAAATNAALALADVTWAEIVFVGAGELGLRARLRAEHRPPEQIVLLWLEPAAEPSWRSAHPTLAAIAERTGAPRRRGRALPAGARPALALYGPDRVLGELARDVVDGLARSTK
ncbi:MAG TPA: hypothetical protein VKB54_16050 [Solirubrobacteraceae bacterium]|nr:hypothetical protein [Solirubrobacteraceae bacterium]